MDGAWLHRLIICILKKHGWILLSCEDIILRLLRPASENGPFWREEDVIVDQAGRFGIARKDVLLILCRLASEGEIEAKIKIDDQGFRSCIYAIPHERRLYGTRNRRR